MVFGIKLFSHVLRQSSNKDDLCCRLCHIDPRYWGEYPCRIDMGMVWDTNWICANGSGVLDTRFVFGISFGCLV